MAVKQKKTATAAIKPRHSVNVSQTAKDESFDDAIARTLTQPEVGAALTIQRWQGDVSEVNTLSKELALQIDEVNKGSIKRPEAMLLAQAHTLDELFNSLARQAKNQDGLAWFEASLRLALKAQSQCRSTLETLATIKNPPVIFAKQANITSGNQQINNGTSASSCAGEIRNPSNELLEAQYGGTTLDTGTTSGAIGKNKAMATVD